MKTNRIYILVTCILFRSIVLAQDYPTVLNMPLKYFESPDGSLLTDGRPKTSQFNWIVFSDRDENKAYNAPSEGTPINTVNFLEKFYVTGESGDFLEVYKWAESIKMEGGGKKVQLNPKKAVRVGWIKKEYLLLWQRCLENPKTHFSQKTMAVTKAENLNVELRKDNSLKIFNNPELSKENNNTVKMFNFLYIYKSRGRAVLVGKISKSNVYRANLDLLGWVDTVFLQSWSDRVCLEPNTDADAVASRQAANVKASLFDEKDEAIAWKEGSGKLKPNWDKDTYGTKWVGSQQRFPIFKTENLDIIYTGYPTSLFKEGTNVELLSNAGLSKYKGAAAEIISDKRKINVIFVIDAGFGMRSYANAITNSLKQLIENNKERANAGARRNVYSYGAVVYRSNEDKVCPGGDLSLNKISLTNNASSVVSFLNKEFENEGCSGNELNKNVNAALLQALNMIKDQNKQSLQSNCIFFIGGAAGSGVADLQTSPALIATYDVNLSVFQALCASQPVEFEQFPIVFRDVINAARAKKLELTKTGGFSIEAKWKKTEIQGDENLYQLDYPKNSQVQGNINFPSKGKAIPSATIDKVLDETISFYEKTLEDDITTLRTNIEGVNTNNRPEQQTTDALNATVKNLLNRLGNKMNDRELATKFNGKNVQFFIPAWTTAAVNRVKDPIFKYVIYVQEDELFDMIKKFEDLQVEAPPSEMREMMYDAYQKLVTAYFGTDQNVDAMFKDKVTIDDILTKVTGLPSSSQLLKDIKINDIKNVGKVSDDQVEEVLKRIRTSLELLKNVSIDLKGTMRNATDDGVYYWIPQDYLP